MTAVLLGLFAAACWSVHDVIARPVSVRAGPFRMGLWIMTGGGLMLTAYVLWQGTAFRATPVGWLFGLALGIAYAAGAAGLYKAFSLGPVSLVGPLSAGYPVLVVAWGVSHGLAPDLIQWLAIAAAMAGAVIVARFGPAAAGRDTVAPGMLKWLLLSCLVSAVGYACAIVIGQEAAVRVGEFEAAWMSRATAAFVFLAAMFLTREVKPAPLKPVHWLGVAAMGGLDVAGLVAVNASGHFPGKEYAAVAVSTYAAMSVILAAMVLKEKVSGAQWAGIGLIVAGIATLSLRQ